MGESSFKYCPICGKPLDSGCAKLYPPRNLLNLEGIYLSDKAVEKYKGHPFKKLVNSDYKKNFQVSFSKPYNTAGYCVDCKKIFAEFDAIDEYFDMDHIEDDDIIQYGQKG